MEGVVVRPEKVVTAPMFADEMKLLRMRTGENNKKSLQIAVMHFLKCKHCKK